MSAIPRSFEHECDHWVRTTFWACLTTLVAACVAAKGFSQVPTSSKLELIDRVARDQSGQPPHVRSYMARIHDTTDYLCVAEQIGTLNCISVSGSGKVLRNRPFDWSLDRGYPMSLAAIDRSLVVVAQPKCRLWFLEPMAGTPESEWAAHALDLPESLKRGIVGPLTIIPLSERRFLITRPGLDWMLVYGRKADDAVPAPVQLIIGQSTEERLGKPLLQRLSAQAIDVLTVTELGEVYSPSTSIDGRFLFVCDKKSNGILVFGMNADRFHFVHALCEDPRNMPLPGRRVRKGLWFVNAVIPSTDGSLAFSVSSDPALTVLSRDTETGKLNVLRLCLGGDEEGAGSAKSWGAQYFPELRNPSLCAAVPGRSNEVIVAEAKGDLLWFEFDRAANTVRLKERVTNTPDRPIGTAGPASMQFSDDGKFLYMSSNESRLAVFKVDAGE